MNHDIVHPLVRQALEKYHITARAIECDADLADTATFCEHYGYSPEQSANTIIVASRTEPVQYFACLVLAHTKLDVNKKLRQLTGVRKLSFASAEQTIALSTMLIGGVTIIGLHDTLPIYIDKAVMDQQQVILGGGNRTSKLLLDPSELTKMPQARIIEQLGLVR